jgi:Skp family chaperone for outer membrane proteins
MKKYLIPLALVCIVSYGSPSAAQRIAYVDQAVAIKEAAGLKHAEAELKKIVAGWRDTLALLKKNYETQYAAFRKDSSSLTPETMRNRASELYNLQLQASQYERLKVNNVTGGDYIAQRNRLIEPLVKQFKEVVAQVAKSEKIDIVVLKEKLVYMTDAVDLTDKVAAKLK